MLVYLELKNYIFIKEMKLEFTNGLNVFTGETGAGKSIIVDAINLVCGERINTSILGEFGDKTEIVAMFDFTTKKTNVIDEINEILTVSGVEFDTNEPQLIFRREIDSQNKSKYYINDKLVSLSILKKISDIILDVHGQNEHQKLLNPAYHLNVLDEFLGLNDIITSYRQKFYLWKQKIKELNEIKTNLEIQKQKLDLLKFQLQEIENAKLTIEDENLEEKLNKAKNAQKVLNLCAEIKYNLIGENGIKSKLKSIEKQLNNLSTLLDVKEPIFDLNKIYAEIENVETKIEEYKKNFFEFTPEIIDNLVDRVDLIKRLKRKYGTSIEEIKKYYEKIKNELAHIDLEEEKVTQLNSEINLLETELITLAKRLSNLRLEGKKSLEEKINQELKILGLPKAYFEVKITSSDKKIENITESGFDKIEFLISTNPEKSPMPLKEIVSGGELSRIMLAIKTVLGEKENTPIMIFDEIDSGVGGPMGYVIGKKLKQLAKSNKQIFCVTHLPQIAVFSDRHFFVTKNFIKNKTEIKVELLTKQQRIKEIARMISTGEVDQTALNHAKKMLQETETM